MRADRAISAVPAASHIAMSRLLIVSNRLPVTVRVEKGEVAVARSAGGLATAMRGPHESMDSLWIGWPGDVSKFSQEQRAVVDQRLAALRTVPVHLSSQELARYYDGFSNGVLWPLFHYLIEKVNLEARRDWEVYRDVNQRFADTVIAHYREGDTIWVHDYQLMLVPQMLRERLPEARIGFFLHIPCPSSEVFRILPWRAQMLRGLLGADLIGFHTASFRHNFAFSAARVLGMDASVDALVHEDRSVRLGVHPISIDSQEFARIAALPQVQEEARKIREAAGDRKVVVGIDRFDYTKGIHRRLLGIERLLENKPDWRKKLRYVQVAVPTREKVDAYADFRRQVNEAVGRINGQFGTIEVAPIHLLHRSVSQEQLVALYVAADVMLVTPLRDGMNLVAKEYVATRSREDGVLVLSEFAGAADEMISAIMNNPYDIDNIASSLDRALSMPPEEQKIRMRALRSTVFGHDVHRWAKDFLAELVTPPKAPRSSMLPIDATAVRAIREAKKRVFLLDYDGTLVPLVAKPELAAPDEELRSLLAKLATRGEVHVVSGRPRDDLSRFLGDLPLTLHAEHGYWTRERGADWKPIRPVSTEWKKPVRAVLDELTERTRGAWVEEKSVALAWHYRQTDPELASARLPILRLSLVDLARTHDLELLSGSRVLEIRPRGVNKGAIGSRVAAQAGPDACIVAIGDDRTDEDLFAALPNAVTIKVGEGQTVAKYRIQTPADVRTLLDSL
jgi:trehalose 6-phosphate synthase/phosphatase